MVYICGVLLSHKTEQNDAISSSMGGPTSYHTKLSSSKRDIIWYHSYVESKIWEKWTYLQSRNRLGDKTNLWLPKGKQGGIS